MNYVNIRMHGTTIKWRVANEVVEEIKTRALFSITFSESRADYEIMWKKYGTAGHATEDNIIQCRRVACWIPNVYKDMLRICNSYCFSTSNDSCANVSQCYFCTYIVCRRICYLNHGVPLGDPDSRHTITPYSLDDRGTLQSFIHSW